MGLMHLFSTLTNYTDLFRYAVLQTILLSMKSQNETETPSFVLFVFYFCFHGKRYF